MDRPGYSVLLDHARRCNIGVNVLEERYLYRVNFLVGDNIALVMERGEQWEYEAVRNQWATIERQRRVMQRLVAAFCLGLVGLVLFMLAMTPEACIYGRGTQNTCIPVTSGVASDVFVIAGIGVLGGGLWLCISALTIETGSGGNGC